MIRVIPFFLYLALIAFHQIITLYLTSVYGVSVNIAAMSVIVVATYKSELTALWFGFFAGLVAAAGLPDRMGWIALLLAALGMGAFHMRARLNLDSIYSKLLLVFGGVFLFNCVSFIVIQKDEFFSRALVIALGGAVYTTVVAWFFSLAKERHLTVDKVRSIF